MGAWTMRGVRCMVPAACVIAFQLVAYPIPWGLTLQGVVIGLLGALVAVGMALVYRSNGILNFAQVELGLAPTVLSVSLITYSAMNYFLALAIGLAGAVLVGAIVELAIIRRFFRSPRLILTVATIGLSQLLVGAALFIPKIWNAQPLPIIVHIPLSFQFTVSPLVFTADHVAAMVVAPLCLLGVALLLRYTSIGIAVRASAERADRASMLGVPVKRLETIVWVVAAVLSFIGIFLQAGILGVPVGAAFNYTVLLSALAALVLGNFVNLPTIALSAVALGVLQQGVLWDQINDPQLIDAVLAVVVIAAIVLRRVGSSRLVAGSVSTWSISDAVRPVPIELRRLAEVRVARVALGGLAATAVLALPWILSGNAGNQLKATAVVVFVMIALSVTILTGWAGQVSLGQMSFVGFGGAVGAYCSQTLHLDLSIALLAAGVAGAVVATVVSLPALRARGFVPAVITLAFAMASSAYLLNPQYFSWIPSGSVTRPRLFGLLSLTSEPGYYYFAATCLAPGDPGTAGYPRVTDRKGPDGAARERAGRRVLRGARAAGQGDRLCHLGIRRGGRRLSPRPPPRGIQPGGVRHGPEHPRLHHRGLRRTGIDAGRGARRDRPAGWPVVPARRVADPRLRRRGPPHLDGAPWRPVRRRVQDPRPSAAPRGPSPPPPLAQPPRGSSASAGCGRLRHRAPRRR